LIIAAKKNKKKQKSIVLPYWGGWYKISLLLGTVVFFFEGQTG
jgi:hypothetical protein